MSMSYITVKDDDSVNPSEAIVSYADNGIGKPFVALDKFKTDFDETLNSSVDTDEYESLLNEYNDKIRTDKKIMILAVAFSKYRNRKRLGTDGEKVAFMKVAKNIDKYLIDDISDYNPNKKSKTESANISDKDCSFEIIEPSSEEALSGKVSKANGNGQAIYNYVEGALKDLGATVKEIEEGLKDGLWVELFYTIDPVDLDNWFIAYAWFNDERLEELTTDGYVEVTSDLLTETDIKKCKEVALEHYPNLLEEGKEDMKDNKKLEAKMMITAPIQKFAKEFAEEYDFLYDNDDNVAGYDEALEEFDSLMKEDKNFQDFVGEFAKYRGDFVSSDREAVAFMFALEKYIEVTESKELNENFKVTSYYDNKYKGVEDSKEFNNEDGIDDYVWEKVQAGNYVEVNNIKTGDVKRYSPDKFDETTIDVSDLLVESKTIKTEDRGDILGTETFGRWRLEVKSDGDFGNIVVFYDMNQDNTKFPEGQNTGASYYVDTLLGIDDGHSIKNMEELRLWGDIPEWTVGKEDLQKMYDWLLQFKKESHETDNYAEIYQMKITDDNEHKAFMPLKDVKDELTLDDYELVGTTDVTIDDDMLALEDIFAKGNTEQQMRNKNPKMRSISVSDIVKLNDKYYYCDSLGWEDVTDIVIKPKVQESKETSLSLSEAETKCDELKKALDEKLPDYDWSVNISGLQVIISDLNSKSDFRYTKKADGFGPNHKVVEDLVKQIFGDTASLDYFNGGDIWAKHKAYVKGVDIVENKTERFLGPSDEVIADCKAKGLYTEGEETYKPTEEEWVGKMKDTNGTFFDVYQHGDKFFDVLGNELDKKEVADYVAKYNKEVKTEAEDTTGTISEELNTGVMPLVNVDMYSMSEELDNVDATSEELDEIVMEVAPKYIEDTIKEILPSVKIEPKSVYHPRQYNFSGDELEFVLTANREEYDLLKDATINDEQFDTFLKGNYSSSSGFISTMADSYKEFEKQPEWKQMVQVIMFNVSTHTIEENNGAYLDEFLEKVHSNFGVIEEGKKIEELSTEEQEYLDNEKALATDYEKRVIDSITDNVREVFNRLKELLENGEDKIEVNGFYFPSEAVEILTGADTNYHLNSYMDLTISNILNVIDEYDTIEEAVKSFFDEYRPDSAYSWADNFVTVLNKVK